ncbi:PA14 domain-containing protein [Paenibacillus filicis]|uniref:PA14 domain-containing protein n=1 Tax=Paenibacillus gyeongsangnamensis TaxID=3388067 RepID=A0ABT4QI08_9BACL|nr:PA14 domain-containing protein [Paenibacillus filicis]MCZ8516489.1 PA14 domain-containing protein [Paenibacillus filicis]
MKLKVLKIVRHLITPVLLVSISCSGIMKTSDSRHVLAASASNASSSTSDKMKKIGTWDGVTEKVTLETPYIDPAQQEVNFGMRSFYHVPWRGYMDTWDSSRFLNELGMGMNSIYANEADATMQVLSEAGITHGRTEMGWGLFSYDDETKFRDPKNQRNLEAILAAYKKYNVRPLILLNAHSSAPVPNKTIPIRLKKEANAGDRQIFVENTAGIIPGYTGLTGQAVRAAMFPVFTAVDSESGAITLSAPLEKPIKDSIDVNAVIFKYQPFQGIQFSDGKPNPAGMETVNGWIKYVETVSEFVRTQLGTEGKADAGFDLEVWNEYTFASEFLNSDNYYNPKLSFSKPLSYTEGGQTVTGSEAILGYTSKFIYNHQERFPGVNVISGFSNQRPWETGSGIWSGQAGFSKHLYTGYESGPISPESKLLNFPVDALNQPDNSGFSPVLYRSFPEYWYYYYQTESLVRDSTPYPNAYTVHSRFSSPGEGRNFQLWESETNWNRALLSDELTKTTGLKANDPSITNLLHQIGAKALLRMYTFFSSKGVNTITVYNAKENDSSYAVIPNSFFTKLQQNKYQLSDEVRKEIGPQLNVIKNIVNLMKTGKKIENPRPLGVDKLVEYKPQLVFEGDGTPEHPSRFNRDDFAVLPYQLDDNKFAIGYYVVTKNLAQVYDQSKSVTDPSRYQMPDQTFDLSLTNIRGKNAKVYSYDPVTDTTTSVAALEEGVTSLSVKLQSTDYPRFLIVEEDQSGPAINQATIGKISSGGVLSFTSNIDATATVSWGPYPLRTTGTFNLEEWNDDLFNSYNGVAQVEQINHDKSLPARKGSWRWTGTITPKYSEKYLFMANTDGAINGLWIDDQLVMDKNQTTGYIELREGETYNLKLDYANPYATPHSMSLYWSSPSQQKNLVAPTEDGKHKTTLQVKKDQIVSIPLDGMTTGDGVKLELTSDDGLYNAFPRWDNDTRGVIYNNTLRYTQ